MNDEPTRHDLWAPWSGQHLFLPTEQWASPRVIHLAGDVFDGRLEHDELGAIFAVMAAAPQHRFVVTTTNMVKWLDWTKLVGSMDDVGRHLVSCLEGFGVQAEDDWLCAIANVINGYSRWESMADDGNPLDGTVKRWPIPWVDVYVRTGIME